MGVRERECGCACGCAREREHPMESEEVATFEIFSGLSKYSIQF